MKLRIFQVDAFSERLFSGNPAAVVPLEDWLADSLLQSIAEENNLAETAFFVKRENNYELRWFTPKQEVPFCGHATLATAFVLTSVLDIEKGPTVFKTKIGNVSVTTKSGLIEMTFPKLSSVECQPPIELVEGLGIAPDEVFRVDDDPNYYAIFADENVVRSNNPNLGILEKLHPYGVVISAPGTDFDIVSRCYAPGFGIPEDPVTGSIHSVLVPYWARKLKKESIKAFQASRRGGVLYCRERDDDVIVAGYATKYMEGIIEI